jgi:hypothetical protein
MAPVHLDGFDLKEEVMIHAGLAVLASAGYDVTAFKEFIRADLPRGYRGMSWPDGAVLGSEAFSSQAVLNHVLEEELIHLRQKQLGPADVFGVGTARALEEAVDESRKFADPEQDA